MNTLLFLDQCSTHQPIAKSAGPSIVWLKWKSFAHLIGGFNPSEKYESKWESSPSSGEHKKYLKPPPSDFLITQHQPDFSLIGRCVVSKVGTRWISCNGEYQYGRKNMFIVNLTIEILNIFTSNNKTLF